MNVLAFSQERMTYAINQLSVHRLIAAALKQSSLNEVSHEVKVFFQPLTLKTHTADVKNTGLMTRLQHVAAFKDVSEALKMDIQRHPSFFFFFFC